MDCGTEGLKQRILLEKLEMNSVNHVNSKHMGSGTFLNVQDGSVVIMEDSKE